MRYRYYICDVFTDTRFGGNQLAVLPEAGGLSDRQMQQIAREFKRAGGTSFGASWRRQRSGSFRWRIAQGVEMGRPSVLEARAEKQDGEVTGAWIGGASVLVSEGWIEVD